MCVAASFPFPVKIRRSFVPFPVVVLGLVPIILIAVRVIPFMVMVSIPWTCVVPISALVGMCVTASFPFSVKTRRSFVPFPVVVLSFVPIILIAVRVIPFMVSIS